MTVSLSWKVEYNIQSLFPLCICLGKLDPNNEPTGVGIEPLVNSFIFLNNFLLFNMPNSLCIILFLF